MKSRIIKRKIKGHATTDGAGVKLIRVLGHDDVKDIDPFLMMDAFDSTHSADYIKGFPMHPHRGIETITYLLEGSMVHRDSLGNEGRIAGGSAQWMTSGSGILHEEMPEDTPHLNGLQFWLNLPRKEKMTVPAYFDITPDMIASVVLSEGTVRVVSGEYHGIQGITSKFVPVLMLDVALNGGAKLDIPVTEGYGGFVYVLEGGGSFGGTELESRTAGTLGTGDTITASAGKQGVRFMLLAGQPLGEPIAWAGPVVMNTQEELNVAFDELRRGTFIKKEGSI